MSTSDLVSSETVSHLAEKSGEICGTASTGGAGFGVNNDGGNVYEFFFK